MVRPDVDAQQQDVFQTGMLLSRPQLDVFSTGTLQPPGLKLPPWPEGMLPGPPPPCSRRETSRGRGAPCNPLRMSASEVSTRSSEGHADVSCPPSQGSSAVDPARPGSLDSGSSSLLPPRSGEGFGLWPPRDASCERSRFGPLQAERRGRATSVSRGFQAGWREGSRERGVPVSGTSTGGSSSSSHRPSGLDRRPHSGAGRLEVLGVAQPFDQPAPNRGMSLPFDDRTPLPPPPPPPRASSSARGGSRGTIPPPPPRLSDGSRSEPSASRRSEPSTSRGNDVPPPPQDDPTRMYASAAALHRPPAYSSQAPPPHGGTLAPQQDVRCCRCHQVAGSYFDHKCPRCNVIVCESCLDDFRMILHSYRCPKCGEEKANQEALQQQVWLLNAYRTTRRTLSSIGESIANFFSSGSGEDGDASQQSSSRRKRRTGVPMCQISSTMEEDAGDDDEENDSQVEWVPPDAILMTKGATGDTAEL
eukprot:TRINITY_DN16915_c0_g2_i1.p1 TRINITY_DN16915_c0_g2~~TRINITY_DN16915_c0_g2_i1.p1  ORF type:complete len:475 (-),score=71.85 TRINITY_DN16915_c0_g2_i1:316-1740(-)